MTAAATRPVALLSLPEAARRLGRSNKTFRNVFSQLRLRKPGEATAEKWRALAPLKVAGRWCVPVAAVEQYLAEAERLPEIAPAPPTVVTRNLRSGGVQPPRHARRPSKPTRAARRQTRTRRAT